MPAHGSSDAQPRSLSVSCRQPRMLLRRPLRRCKHREKMKHRIVFFANSTTTVLQYVIRDLAAALGELGHEAIIISDVRSYGEILPLLRAAKPTAVWLLSFVRDEQRQ